MKLDKAKMRELDEKMRQTSVTYKYEVDVGSSCGTGYVTVPYGSTDDDIRLAIMDDLYDVSYERVDEE